MSLFAGIPQKLESWKFHHLKKLSYLRDIESERFDFKGSSFRDLDVDICAMANTLGGYLVLGVEENKSEDL